MREVIEINDINPLSYNQYLKNGRYGQRYKTKKGASYESKIKSNIKNIEDIKPSLLRIQISIDFYITNKRKNDVDNLIKPILDILTGIFYADDCQVCDLRVRKKHSPRARIRIIIQDELP